jgi:AcrR family transcriptional regulator
VRTQRRLALSDAIRATAHQLFVEHGYRATTIAAVADAAGVAVQTVYDAFGSKRELLRAAVRAASIGDDTATMLDSAWLGAVTAEDDLHRRWALLREATAAVLERALPMARVVRAAALSDPGVQELWEEIEEERRRDVEALIHILGEVGELRVPHPVAVDITWALSRSTDLYAALVIERGWAPDQAFAAVSDAIARAILPDPLS